ncbi:MAG: glycosyltransferase [Aeromicrobium sp.]
MAIAHDYLTQRGGAERVVLAMAKAFPEAPIYTLLYAPDSTFPEFRDLDIRTMPINRIRLFRRFHRLSLPLLPFAASSKRIDADVVLASSSGWAHGFRTTGRKVVYCYSPARWLYQSKRYLGENSSLTAKITLFALRPFLRRWDKRAAASADEYLAISTEVRGRILDLYGRGSTLIPAPYSDAVTGTAHASQKLITWVGDREFHLCVSRLLPYKNVTAVVEAFAREPHKSLIVVGRGPLEHQLRANATPNVLFLKDIPDAELAWLYEKCRSLIAVSFEDYGLTPIEAASFGKPSIVLRWGGYLDTTIEGITAVYVEEPRAANIRAAMNEIESQTWDVSLIAIHAAAYTESQFVERLRNAVLFGPADGTGSRQSEKDRPAPDEDDSDPLFRVEPFTEQKDAE